MRIERTKQTVTMWSGLNGLQGGDPAKLADAIAALEQKAKTILRSACRLAGGEPHRRRHRPPPPRSD